MARIIDSHCHLNHEKTAPGDDPAAIMARARAAGVGGAITICCEIAREFDDVLALARSIPDVWCSIGTHPHEAAKPDEQAITLDRLVELATSDPKVVGIGETGLDYYYNHSPVAAQQDSFRKHIRACLETDLPLIVHARDADDDVARILREENRGGKLRGVMHCFSSGPALAQAAIDMGFYLSFSGIVTFKKAEELRAVVRDTPMDRILVETDAPYLAPEPHRGAVNEPALIVHTVATIAVIKGITPEVCADQTTQNFFTLFDRAKT